MIGKKYISAAMALATVVGLVAAITVFAASDTSVNHPNGAWRGQQIHGQRMMKPAIVGTVSAINGTTLTVSGRQGFGTSTASTVFTVDASNAQVMKDNAKTTVSSIAVGDTVFVQGTVNGSSVNATMIRDGKMPGGPGKMDRPKEMSTSTLMQGNGQPIVAGTISAINGSTLSITNKSNVAYTIDASNAKILKGQNTVSLSDISVGDTVVVQGTINGTSVVASSVIDQTAPANGNQSGSQQPHPGFFGMIGQFFMHLFGF